MYFQKASMAFLAAAPLTLSGKVKQSSTNKQVSSKT